MGNMDIQIKKAKISDLKHFTKIGGEMAVYYQQITPDTKKVGNKAVSEFKKSIAEILKKRNYQVYLIFVDNEVTGFFAGCVKKGETKLSLRKGYIYNVFIIEKFRKLGLLAMVMKEFTKWLKEQNIKYIDLDVNPSNTLGVSVWNKLGFKEISKIMRLSL